MRRFDKAHPVLRSLRTFAHRAHDYEGHWRPKAYLTHTNMQTGVHMMGREWTVASNTEKTGPHRRRQQYFEEVTIMRMAVAQYTVLCFQERQIGPPGGAQACLGEVIDEVILEDFKACYAGWELATDDMFDAVANINMHFVAY